MSNRGSSTAFRAEIVKDQTHSCHLLEVYLDTQTYYLTDNHFDITFNSNSYSALGSFLGFDSIEESAQITANSLTLTLSGVDQTYTNLFLTENYVDRRVIIRKAFLNTSSALIADPVIIFDGRMDSPAIQENADSGMASVTVGVSNQFIDFENIPGRFTNHENQQLHYPGDLGFEYASQIIKDIVWGSEFDAGNRVSGAGALSGQLTGSSLINEIDIGYDEILITNPWGGVFSIDIGVYNNKIRVNEVDHGKVTGVEVVIENATGTTGVSENDLNGTKVITVVDADTYEFAFDLSGVNENVQDLLGGKETTINEEVVTTKAVFTETTTNKKNYVTTIDVSEEAAVGDFIQFENTGDIGGITDEKLGAKSHEVKEIAVINGTKIAKVAVTETKKTTAPPISTDTSVANTITLNLSEAGFNVGDTVVIAGAEATGGVAASSINGTKTIASIKSNDAFNITVSDNVTSTVVNGGGNSLTVDTEEPDPPPLTTTASSTTVTLKQTTHNLEVGDTVEVIASKDVGGIPATDINKEHVVASVPDANTVTFAVETAATTAESGGGADTYVELPVKATAKARGGQINTKIKQKVARTKIGFRTAF